MFSGRSFVFALGAMLCLWLWVVVLVFLGRSVYALIVPRMTLGMSTILFLAALLFNTSGIAIRAFFARRYLLWLSFCGRMTLCLLSALSWSVWTFCRLLLRPISPRWLDGCNCSVCLSDWS